MTVALGWCRDGAAMPPAVTLHSTDGGLALAAGIAPLAQDRMRLQAAVVAAGQDILPTAPRTALSVATALASQPHGLKQRFASLAGQVQMSLTVTPKAGPGAPRAKTGRAWLHRKQAEYDHAATWSHRLLGLAASVSPQSTTPRWTNGRLHCAVLIPRDQDRALTDRVEAALHHWPAADITITGPWPPYAFTTSTIVEHAAA